jgi:hypothetical protein
MPLTSLLGGLFSRSSPSRSATNRRSPRLHVESLEERCVPATLVRPIEDFVSQQGTYLVDSITVHSTQPDPRKKCTRGLIAGAFPGSALSSLPTKE